MKLVRVPLAALMGLITIASMFALLGPAISPSATQGSDTLLADVLSSVDLTLSHGEFKHGAVTAATIRQLCSNGGALRLFQQDKNRFVQICQIDSRYGCRILDLFNMQWFEVTTYVKSCFDGRTLDDIDRYAESRGWTKSTEVVNEP